MKTINIALTTAFIAVAGIIVLRESMPPKMPEPVEPLQGTVVSENLGDKPLITIKTVCLAMDGANLKVKMEANAEQFEAANAAAAEANKAAEAYTALPVSATDEMETTALASLSAEDQKTVLNKALELKKILRGASSTIFSEYDARRFFISETANDAARLNQVLHILRKQVFTDIAEQPSGLTMTPDIALENGGIGELVDFVDTVMVNISEDDPTPDTTKIFRDYVQDGNLNPRLTPEQNIDNDLKITRLLVKEYNAKEPGINHVLNNVFKDILYDTAQDSLPVRITYSGQPSPCKPL